MSFDLFQKRLYQATGIKSQKRLADVLGVHRSAISQAKKKNVVPNRWIFKIADIFDINPAWLENGKGPVSHSHEAAFVKVPKVKARLCAGSGSFETEAVVDDYLLFQASQLHRRGNPDQMVVMDVYGNSMEPELKDGDTILVDQGQKDIIAGAVYAIGIDDTIMVKRVEKRPGRLVLLSDNPQYAPIYLKAGEMDSFRVAGRVLWVCRELT